MTPRMSIPCDILLRAGTLVTQDARRRVLTNAAIAIQAGAILAVDGWEALSGLYQPRETIDCRGDIVLPGLINTHTHAAMTVFRGLEDDLPLMEWLQGHIWPAEARLTPEIVAVGTALACAEMLRTGTTCFVDLYLFEREVAQAVLDAGMRAVLGEGVFDQPNASAKTPDEALAKMGELMAFCRGQERLKPCMVAHSVYATGADTLLHLDALAREHRLMLTLHAAETASETAMVLAQTGQRPIARLETLGLLTPRLLAAHVVDVTEEEITLLARRGVGVAHNPRSNMKLGSGAAPVAALRRAGVRVGLGTDGAASNNALNMFAEMNAAALLAKLRGLDPTALPAKDVLDMATRDGAMVAGWPELGSIEPGKRADLAVLDGSAPNLQPPHNPVSHLVYAASGAEVRLTMVEGRVLYRDGAFTSFDYPALVREMSSIRAWARKNT